MKRYKHFFRYRNKVLGAFIMCSILPIITLSLVSYLEFTQNSKDRIINDTLHRNIETVAVFDDRMEQVMRASDSIHSNILSIVDHKTEPISEYFENYSNAKRSINSICNAFGFSHLAVYINSSLPVSNEGLTFFSLESFKNSKFYLESDLQPQGIDHQWGEFTDVDLPDNISENSPRLISCYRIIRNKIAGEIDYAYYISITSSEFADTIKNHFVGTPINGYIVSSDGDQIASNVLQKENTFTPQMAKSIIEDNMYSIGNYQYVVTKFSKTNWYFISEIPNSYIQNYVTESMGTTILGIVIVFFVAIVAIFWITNRLTTRINFSIRIVKEYIANENDFPDFFIPYRVSYSDELDYLFKTLNHMVRRLNTMHNNILVLSMHKEKLKYELLQSKINPHFLYNILDSIKACQTSGDLETASSMIIILSKFYRHMLKKSDELIFIQDEIETCEAYLKLETMCRKGCVLWEFRIAPDIDRFKICRFCLQPIVENCINHGFQYGRPPLKIRITMKYTSENIQIKIVDNGKGILPVDVKKIREALSTQLNDPSSFYGLCNVNLRLKLYSEQASVQISSKINWGTKVEIIFPQIL